MKLLDSKNFIRGIWLLLILLIIFVGEKVSFIFHPFVIFIKIFFLPLSFAIVFYYIFVPAINWMERKNIKRVWGTSIFFIAIISLIVISMLFLGSSFQKQFYKLAEYLSNLTFYFQQAYKNVIEHPLFARFQDSGFIAMETLSEYFTVIMDALLSRINADFSSLISLVSNTLISIVLFPVFLFYLLVDVRELNKKVVSFIPPRYKVKGDKIITEIDTGLNAFIKGRLLVCLFVGVLTYAGYLIVGIEAPLVLATIMFFANFIPYLGPILGSIPALAISLIASFSMFVRVLIVIVVVQQIESVFISPQVMNKKLMIHPVLVMVLIILGGHFAGILGVLFAVPFYLIIRVLAINLLPDKYGDKIKG